MIMGRNSKIGSLPLRIREELNRRLQDGQGGPDILPWVNGLPETKSILEKHFAGIEISAENLSEYKNGPHLDWLEQQQSVEQTRALAEFSMRHAAASGDSLSEGAVALLSGKIFESIQTGLEDGDLLEIIKATSNLRHAEIASVRAKQEAVKLEQKERQLALEEAKFQRSTAEKWLDWYNDQRAKEIAEGKGDKEVKMQALIQLMFGDRPA